MAEIYESCIRYLNLHFVENLGWDPHPNGSYTRPFSAEHNTNTILRWIVRPRVFDLGARVWVNCDFGLQMDITDAEVPNVLLAGAHIDYTSDERRWLALYESTPFHETTWAPTTAGCVDERDIPALIEGFIVQPSLEFEGAESRLLTSSNLFSSALNPTDGYRVDPARWRASAIAMALCGYSQYSLTIVDLVGSLPRMRIDSESTLRECRAALESIATHDFMSIELSDDGHGEVPTYPQQGQIVPARASFRCGEARGSSPIDSRRGGGSLTTSFLGGGDLDMWMEGMSVLDIEFFVYDVLGDVTGDACGSIDGPVIERHLLDTFASWDEAALPANRDLLDRYQRHPGQMALTLRPGRWVERRDRNMTLDPVVEFDDGDFMDPTVVIREALTQRTGDSYAQLIGFLDGNR